MHNFDKRVDRRDTLAHKWDKTLLERHFGSSNVTPLWVAEMDFEVSKEIKKALKKRLNNSVLGYEKRDDSLVDSIIKWHQKKDNWKIKKESLRFSSGILNTIAVAINIFTNENDAIIIQPPVFFQFKHLILKNNREVFKNPLKLIDNKYTIDFKDLEEKAANPKAKMLILCNPHNPVGRVWSKKELEKINKIAIKHNIIVISDEIHGNITFKKSTFTPYASLSKKAALNSMSCISPAKSFNIPGTSDSMVVINNKKHREKFDEYVEKLALNRVNILNNVAMKAAFEDAQVWHEELLKYLEENLRFLIKYIKKHIPKVKLIEPEGSFLVWLDFRELNMDVKELEEFLVKESHLALNSGYWFGREGAGFARMTFAVPKITLKKALKSLEFAIKTKELTN